MSQWFYIDETGRKYKAQVIQKNDGSYDAAYMGENQWVIKRDVPYGDSEHMKNCVTAENEN